MPALFRTPRGQIFNLFCEIFKGKFHMSNFSLGFIKKLFKFLQNKNTALSQLIQSWPKCYSHFEVLFCWQCLYAKPKIKPLV